MGPINIRLPFYASYTTNGDWIHYDTNPKLILTEKINAFIAMWFRKDSIFTLSPIPVTMSKIKQTQQYNISKFLLLKEITHHFLVDDILSIIVNLSD